MASARGDALDWALALARAPGERHALRQRPLPDGMDVVLQVAAGHAAAIEEAAAHAGKPAAEVVEAARFYLREMLFFPDADAYRVLGLAAGASDEQVKHHHRLLQQWLHPDRPTSDWDAAFAARVNAAWSQLRTPAKREAYAATLAVAPAVPPAATDSMPSWSPPTRLHAHVPDAGYAPPALDEGRWRRRAPVLALFGVCAVLGVLAVRDMQQEPERALASGELVATPVTDEAPEVALQLPAPAAEQAPAKKPSSAQKPPQRVAVAPAPRVSPVPMAAKPAVKPVTPAAPRPVAVASKPAPKPITPPARPITPPPVAVAVVPKPKPAPAKPVATALAPAPKPPVAVAVAVPPKPAAKAVAVAAPVPVKPVVKTAAVVSPKPPVVAVAKPVAVPAARPAPVAVQPPAPKPTVVAAPAVAPAPVAAPPPATNSPAQVAQAQQTGQRLLAYVSGRGGGVPPIWANVASQTQASRAREALQGAGRIAVGTPNWRVGDTTAAMQASLTPRDGSARRLRVDMVWREQRWLVTALALEQAP